MAELKTEKNPSLAVSTAAVKTATSREDSRGAGEAGTTRCCSSCLHWRKGARRMVAGGGGQPVAIGDTIGECRAEPPRASFVWPRTYEQDECGGWKARAAAAARTTVGQSDSRTV